MKAERYWTCARAEPTEGCCSTHRERNTHLSHLVNRRVVGVQYASLDEALAHVQQLHGTDSTSI